MKIARDDANRFTQPSCHPVALSLFQFSVTPFLRAVGFYRYHSAMLNVSYLEGLRDIAIRVETGEITGSVMVTGTSYFFSERSAARGARSTPARAGRKEPNESRAL